MAQAQTQPIEMKKEVPIKYALPLRVKRLEPSALPDMANIVKGFANTQSSNRARVAKALGMSSATLNGLLKGRNPRIELLLALSQGLEFNLLDLYLPLLPERLRQTNETRALQAQLEQLQEEKNAVQQKLEASEREREMLLSILKGPKP